MAPNSPANRPENYPSAPPPPPGSSPHSATPNKPARKSKLLIGGISAGVILALGAGAAAIALTKNDEKLAEYDDAHDELTTASDDASELIEEAGALEPKKRDALEEQRTEADDLLSSTEPSIISWDIDDRTAELLDGTAALVEPAAALEDAMANRRTYNTSSSDAEERLAEAQDLLAATENKVADDDAHDQLANHVTALEEALDGEPDETSGQAFADSADEIGEASDNISGTVTAVSVSHDEWQEAEEEAAQVDPDNYDTPSERDWQLVERDPDAYEDEQYVLYGAVTQADASTGDMTIRANTGPTQQSRQYDYDVNTMVLAGNPDVFADVVQGDHVKILVKIVGSMSYDTMIGGSATAVMTTGYDVEVIGQF